MIDEVNTKLDARTEASPDLENHEIQNLIALETDGEFVDLVQRKAYESFAIHLQNEHNELRLAMAAQIGAAKNINGRDRIISKIEMEQDCSYLVISDKHFTLLDDPIHGTQFTNALINFMQTNGIKHVVMLGDMFDLLYYPGKDDARKVENILKSGWDYFYSEVGKYCQEKQGMGFHLRGNHDNNIRAIQAGFQNMGLLNTENFMFADEYRFILTQWHNEIDMILGVHGDELDPAIHQKIWWLLKDMPVLKNIVDDNFALPSILVRFVHPWGDVLNHTPETLKLPNNIEINLPLIKLLRNTLITTNKELIARIFDQLIQNKVAILAGHTHEMKVEEANGITWYGNSGNNHDYRFLPGLVDPFPDIIHVYRQWTDALVVRNGEITAHRIPIARRELEQSEG